MSRLAIKAGTPISCFVKILGLDAYVKFFAPNGKEESFCGHGFISIARHLHENNLGHVTNLITASGVGINAKVLENGMSCLEIPVDKFDIISCENNEILKLFSLDEDNIIEIFKARKLGDILVEIPSANVLRNLTFTKEEVIKYLRDNNIRSIGFFCKDSLCEFADVEIRVFYVNLETLEDVVCGSVNISAAQILFKKYGISKYRVVQPFNFNLNGKIGGYQEVEYNKSKEILILKGYTKAKEELIFISLDIKFDKNLNPISKTEDYYFLKNILMDIDVMKTSTAFAGGIPKTEKELHLLMSSLLETNKNYKEYYGLQKIFSGELDKFIGVGGLIRTKKRIYNYKNIVVEGARFLKSEYIGKGFGLILDGILAKRIEALDVILVGSVWESHVSSNHLLIKYGMQFVKKFTKTYENKVININTYIKFPSSLKTSKVSDIENFLISKKIT
jgi:predicted PhzF superfamily epimerase YddE/YHI9